MNAIAICHRGIEDIAALDIKRILNRDSNIEDMAVFFEGDEKDIIKVAYLGQAIKRVLIFLAKATIANKLKENMPLLKDVIEVADLNKYIEKKTFKVVCKRIGEHEFSSQEIAEKIGELLLDKYRHMKATVRMEDPEVVIYVFINQNKLYLGIDVCGFDLSKRDYKIFSSASSLNGAVAYALVRIADFEEPQTLLDPFCGAGTIPIEAALWLNGISPNFYRKDKFIHSKLFEFDLSSLDMAEASKARIIAFDSLLQQMKAAKKNAQIAGVHKNIEISKVDIEWLDTKVDEKSVDAIVTQPPSESKYTDKKKMEKLYKEFFYQAEFVLKNKGKIIMAVENDELLKKMLQENAKFRVVKVREIMQGSKLLKALILAAV